MERPKYTRSELYMFDDLPSAVLINVENGSGGLMYAYSNPFFAHSLGYEHEEMVELLKEDVFAAIYEADRGLTQNARASVIEGEIVNSISRQKKKDGSPMWILAHVRPIELDGRRGMFFLFSRIEELIGLQNELTEKNDEWSDILQSVPIGLLVYRETDGRRDTLSVNRHLIDFANSVGSQLDDRKRNWTEAELMMVFNKDLYSLCVPDDIPLIDEMLEECRAGYTAQCIFRLRGSNQEYAKPVYIRAACTSKKNEDESRIFYVTYQNVTDSENQRIELIENQARLFELSYYDALTGVKNRNAYNSYIEECKGITLVNVGFAFCDINGLKQTNDTLGHTQGDNMIKQFASILKMYFDMDHVFRLSGDEFVIISPNTSRDSFRSKMDSLISRVSGEGGLASIGYIWEESVFDIQGKITQTEQIMYVEKQKYYESSNTVRSKHRPRMLGLLMKEFDEDRFVMYLQPKTSIDGKKVIGAEALVRKIEKDGNVVQPAAFIPQLEQEKLISMVDFFMLERSCEFLQNLHLVGNDQFSVSVNVSRVTIVENDFIERVTSILNRYDFNRINIEFELTESNKTLDSFRLEDYMTQLRALGVKISIDDMGNDYSSLNLLTLEGFNWVKLDRSLIIRLNQGRARLLVKNIINTCHDLDLKVIAEGVETDEVRELLLDMGCDAYQGYLKSRPIPEGEFMERFLPEAVEAE